MEEQASSEIFRTRNGRLCVKRRCPNCCQEFSADVSFGHQYCPACRQLKKFRNISRIGDESMALRGQASLKNGQRKCHDCGKPSNGNYRCAVCWEKIRGGGGSSLRVDGNWVY